MANCIDCNVKIGFLNKGDDGRCDKCSTRLAEAAYAEKIATADTEWLQKKQAHQKQEEDIAAVMLTTETAPSLTIIKRVEIVTAECAFGMNIFKDLFAGVRDIVGGRSEAVQRTMRDARRTALYELKREAHLVGANAVVGVDLDYVEISSGGNMVMLVASGTAVVIEV